MAEAKLVWIIQIEYVLYTVIYSQVQLQTFSKI